MQAQIDHQPSFAWLKVQLDPGETIQAEAGAMVTMTPGLPMSTRLNAGRGGFFRKIMAFFVAFVRKFIGGETFFVNRFGGEGGGEVVLAPALSGDITQVSMTPNTPPLIIQKHRLLDVFDRLDKPLASLSF